MKLSYGRYRFAEYVEGDTYDLTHPLANVTPSRLEYMTQGTIVVEDLEGNVLWSGKTFDKLNDRFNLGYQTRNGLANKLKRGKNPLVPNHVTYITLPNSLSFYGGDIYK